ncbi:methyltransferase domain-containing protein [Streptomyces sp. NPDC023327]|uniref:class I SAM-dependent methyltransferase n=1 Tax=Streptomyces sp. NPDC023327 TaxID=3157088 RepID=UPI0034005549
MAPQDGDTAGELRSDGDAYRAAFDLFLAGTNQKTRTRDYLTDVVSQLPARRVFLDVGPADGSMTRHVGQSFEQMVCIEPSSPMREALARNCPDARVLAEPVLQADLDITVDLALLSHVLYYVPRRQWTAAVLRVMGWLAPGGLLLILMEKSDSSCMRMVEHFTGTRFDLRELADELRAQAAELVGGVRLETVTARYRTEDLDEAVAVADFHLSVPSDPDRDGVDGSSPNAPVSRKAVEVTTYAVTSTTSTAATPSATTSTRCTSIARAPERGRPFRGRGRPRVSGHRPSVQRSSVQRSSVQRSSTQRHLPGLHGLLARDEAGLRLRGLPAGLEGPLRP